MPERLEANGGRECCLRLLELLFPLADVSGRVDRRSERDGPNHAHVVRPIQAVPRRNGHGHQVLVPRHGDLRTGRLAAVKRLVQSRRDLFGHAVPLLIGLEDQEHGPTLDHAAALPDVAEFERLIAAGRRVVRSAQRFLDRTLGDRDLMSAKQAVSLALRFRIDSASDTRGPRPAWRRS